MKERKHKFSWKCKSKEGGFNNYWSNFFKFLFTPKNLQGKRQSPINIDPGLLQYDPNLQGVSVDKQGVSGRVTNTGQTLVFRVEEGQLAINITGGPLAYKYQFEVSIHITGGPLA